MINVTFSSFLYLFIRYLFIYWVFTNFFPTIYIAKDCAERWLSLRSRFSKERGKIIRSGKNTDWPLMEHLVFLHGHVRKRRSFGIPLGNTDSRISTTNITSEEDENTFLESEIGRTDVLSGS